MNLFAALLSLIAPARADACSTGDAPFFYAAASCRDVCTFHEELYYNYIQCELDTGTTTQGGLLYSATERSGTSGNEFSFWGEDSEGNDFCCAFDNDGDNNYIEHIQAFGTSMADDMRGSDGPGTYWLYEPTSVNNVTLTLVLQGYEGDDDLYGTFNMGIEQEFRGDEGADNIDCRSSISFVEAGTGNDTVIGSDYGDEIWADDWGYATGDDDAVTGGGGDDIIRGQGGEDHLCGDGGEDTIYGGNDLDYLYGDADTDSLDGGGSLFDRCGSGSGFNPGCEVSITVRPVACPNK